jgi:hypothetical protein
MTTLPKFDAPASQPYSSPLLFAELGRRQVVADFSGGYLSSDGGALLLRQLDAGLGLSARLAQAFTDQRDPRRIDHPLPDLLRQRLYGLALGYEDLNDHEFLRRDPLLAVAVDKPQPLGEDRRHAHPPGVALAGVATLNRLELGNQKSDRTHKIQYDPLQVEACLLEMGVRCLPKHAPEIVVDLDTMGPLVHGAQEGRYFNAYYDGYCYLPLYAFAGDIPLWAQLRPGDVDGAEGVVPALEKIVPAIRKRCQRARIIIRGDSGFGREEIMAWCERQAPRVYYCLGLSRNSRLEECLAPQMALARERHCLSGAASTRVFTEFEYQTLKSWSRARRVIGKAEVMAAGENPRFIVTNLPARGFRGEPDRERFRPDRLYEELYCARGDMENQLKQQVLDLQADRLSTHYLGSNQLRLWLATLAYLLLERLRALGLAGTGLAAATVGTIRLRLLKVAASVRVSVRRVYVQLSSAFTFQAVFRRCQQRLGAWASARR